MLANVLALLAVAALGAHAVEPCQPPSSSQPPPSSTSSSASTGPTGAVSTLKNRGKCMDVSGANYADGTKVQIYDCNGTGAQKWNLKRGESAVTITGNGKTFCLDAGTNPTSGSLVKIWTCYSGLPQQDWYYTNDNRLALTNQGLCLDLPSGNTANGQQLQVWACSTGNSNQEWTSTLGTAARRRQYARKEIADRLE